MTHLTVRWGHSTRAAALVRTRACRPGWIRTCSRLSRSRGRASATTSSSSILSSTPSSSDLVPQARTWEVGPRTRVWRTKRWVEGLRRGALGVSSMRLRFYCSDCGTIGHERDRMYPFRRMGTKSDEDGCNSVYRLLLLPPELRQRLRRKERPRTEMSRPRRCWRIRAASSFIQEVGLAMDALGNEIAAAQEVLCRDS